MTLNGEGLIRRFLQHVLPKGFMRIRHFGFLANRCRETKLEQIRQALKVPASNERVGNENPEWRKGGTLHGSLTLSTQPSTAMAGRRLGCTEALQRWVI